MKHTAPKLTPAQCAALYARAVEAGRAAAEKCHPTPMLVGSPSTPLGNDIDFSQPTYLVNDGACGFAWVIVRPGNSTFANWLKKQGHARPDSYYGGVNIWIGDYHQSMALKEAHARAMAEVFREAGVSAYSSSRMD